MVRAASGGLLYDWFKGDDLMAIGWSDFGSLEDLATREAIIERIEKIWAEGKKMQIRMAAGQLHRFRSEMQNTDRVVTYDPSRRIYLIGTITGAYRYDPAANKDYPNVRPVKWDNEVSRDLLSVASKNSLGAISTIFLIPEEVAGDIERGLKTQAPAEEGTQDVEDAEEDSLLKDIQARAIEFTKDRLSSLTWDDMQELVAGLLRAMGYKTRVSPPGSDRGKDIVASPDGFGLESPRIVVEVKHRTKTIGSPEIRSFLGGRHPDDKGLYVSTGGFSREAHYEAERASIPITLMDIDDLVQALIDHYDKLDIETQRLLPLRRIYWPS